jgi:hypothetical protein
MDPGSTLVVYNLMQHPLRSTIRDHLYSFRRYGRGRTFYLNMAVRTPLPRWLESVDFDTVIFHTSFLSQRWIPELFSDQLRRAEPLRGLGRARLALPQDEFIHSRMLSDFINDFEIDHVLSVAPPSEWPKIYATVDRERVGFSLVLTGYLSEETVARIDQIVARQGARRPVDVGYRAWAGAPWLGRHGMLKRRVGEVFAEEAPKHGLSTDISMDDDDVLNGDDWFRFLAACKYTVGVEGGATVLDSEGTFKQRTETYLEQHPEAGFDEVEAACFPGEDGKLELLAISPRHLEACATRTCQVLIEGSYSGALEAGRHYIPLAPDFSNIADVLEEMKEDGRRAELTEAAHRDIVASGRYSYEGFVRTVERAAAEASAGKPAPIPTSLMPLRHAGSTLADRASWVRVAITLRHRPRISALAVRVLPDPVVGFLRRRIYGTAVAEHGPGRRLE